MGQIERVLFLDRLIEAWERRYSAFVRSSGKSEFYAGVRDPIQAADFTLTIAGLAARRDSI